MKIQVCIPSALCALHNFIKIHGNNKDDGMADELDLISVNPSPGDYNKNLVQSAIYLHLFHCPI